MDEEAIAYAKKHLEDLLSFYGLNTDVHATSEDGQVIELDVPSSHLNGFLIGYNAENMRAIQYLISQSLHVKGYKTTRVSVDIANYKKHHAEKVADKFTSWIEEVKNSGEIKHLPPLNAADRRTIHKLAEEHGLKTVSEGEGPARHIVLSRPEQ
jgi:spoIIIJ-associated protein